jgi:hypothetical protein
MEIHSDAGRLAILAREEEIRSGVFRSVLLDVFAGDGQIGDKAHDQGRVTT